MTILTLGSGEITAEINAANGGVIQSIRCGGKEMLAQMPWKQEPPIATDVEAEWLKSWAGGWQLLVPNAGSASLIAKPHQGFHGNASVQEWKLVSHTDTACIIEWQEADLKVTREIHVESQKVSARTTLTNFGQIKLPYIATEHCIFGETSLAFPATLSSANGVMVEELGYDGGKMGSAKQSLNESGLASIEGTPTAKLYSCSNVDGNGFQFETASHRLSMTWDVESLPYMWLWLELNSTLDAPWNGRVQAIGLEPSNADHGLGLDECLTKENAKYLPAGQTIAWWITLNIYEKGASNV